MSISTTNGDKGTTRLTNGVAVSKSDSRVEAYGTIDELVSSLGLARVFNSDVSIKNELKEIQRELFNIAAILANTGNNTKPFEISKVKALTDRVHELEQREGVFKDWALPGESAAASFLDVSRTICRRAERHIVSLVEIREHVDPNIISYINRLSDLLWLYGRITELQEGVDGRLRIIEEQS